MKLLAAVVAGVVVIAAVAAIVVFSDDDNDGDGETVRVAPAAIVDTPEIWYREPVRVLGRVSEIASERRFALSGPDGAVLVQPEPTVPMPERGDEVEVLGTVNYVSRVGAEEAERVGQAPAGEGAPFVSAGAVNER